MVDDLEKNYSSMEPPSPQIRQEELERFEEKLGLRPDPEELALEMFRASMIMRGLDPDTPPEMLPPELAAELHKAQDQFIPGTFMGDPNDPARRREE